MKDLFFKNAPVILGVFGVMQTGFGYLVDKFSNSEYFGVFALTMAMTNVLVGVSFGVILQRVYRISLLDTLTNLTNRRGFYKDLMKAIDNLNNLKSASLIMIDVDGFKLVNDSYGHPEGDKVLIQIAKILQQNIRTDDSVARLGGEEFAVVLPRTNSEGAYILAERIRETIENHRFEFDGMTYNITVSVGVATTFEVIDNNQFIKLADSALYKAKETKNLVVSEVFTGSVY